MKVYAGLWIGATQLERWGPIEFDPGAVYFRIDGDLLEQAIRAHRGSEVEIRIVPGHILEAEVQRELEEIDRLLPAVPESERAELLRDRAAIARRLEPRRRV